jgi:hypothetical protein
MVTLLEASGIDTLLAFGNCHSGESGIMEGQEEQIEPSKVSKTVTYCGKMKRNL